TPRKGSAPTSRSGSPASPAGRRTRSPVSSSAPRGAQRAAVARFVLTGAALARFFAPGAALACFVAAAAAAAGPLIVPQRPDSVSIESPPAPLLVPGRAAPVDTTLPTPQQFARGQYALGQVMERQGNLPGALMAYRNAAGADSSLRGPSYAAGMLEMKMKVTSRAADSFREEVRRNPKNLDAARELGIALSAEGKHTEAIDRLRRLTVRAPSDDRAWYAYGVALASAGRTKEAESPLRKAIALAPARAIEHRDLGVVLAQLGRVGDARTEYRRALAVDASDPSIWIDLGNVESRAGRTDSALVAYREAERRDSSYALAYEAQIKTYEQL